MKVFFEFFDRGITSKAMRSTFLVLIPTREGAKSMGDFRLISLVNSLCKVISKVLSTRLRSVIGEVVSSTQSAFIQGR